MHNVLLLVWSMQIEGCTHKLFSTVQQQKLFYRTKSAFMPTVPPYPLRTVETFNPAPDEHRLSTKKYYKGYINSLAYVYTEFFNNNRNGTMEETFLKMKFFMRQKNNAHDVI